MKRVSPTAASDSSTSFLRSRLPILLCRSGSSTLLRTDAHGIRERLYSWNTSAISSGGDVTRLPRRTTSPRLGGRRPPTHFRSVVLPQPEGPTTQTNSRSSTPKETSPTAWVALTPEPYVFPRDLISSTRFPTAPSPRASPGATPGRGARRG